MASVENQAAARQDRILISSCRRPDLVVAGSSGHAWSQIASKGDIHAVIEDSGCKWGVTFESVILCLIIEGQVEDDIDIDYTDSIIDIGGTVMTYSMIPPYEEHRFWLEILQDHAYFVRDHLSPVEQQAVLTAQRYIDSFQSLLAELVTLERPGAWESPAYAAFAAKAAPVAEGYFRFEGSMQRLRLENRIDLNLTPTYLNGTLNENQEYVRILSYAVRGQTYAPLPLVDLMDLWLEDQLGHALLLANVLDPGEAGLLARTAEFTASFRALFTQNELIRGYLRFSPANLPVQIRLAREALEAVQGFNSLVISVIRLYRGTELLSRTTLRFLEHHLPETCYFMRKLAEFIPGSPPMTNCSLTKPGFPDNLQSPTNPPVV